MKNVIVVMSSNRQPEGGAVRSLERLQKLGAGVVLESGSADVSQARNIALSKVCEALRAQPERDAVLMMDDDMEIPTEVAHVLVVQALKRQRAVSAVYATLDARNAGGPWPESRGGGFFADGVRKWQMGLGCLVIPAKQLLELEATSESYEIRGLGVLTEFTWSEAEKGEWVAEDFRLCRRLGGVELVPVGVGHIKKVPLWPDDETINEVNKLHTQRDGEPRSAEDYERWRIDQKVPEALQ